MTDIIATKLTRMCTGLALFGALLGLLLNSGAAAQDTAPVAGAPVVAQAAG